MCLRNLKMSKFLASLSAEESRGAFTLVSACLLKIVLTRCDLKWQTAWWTSSDLAQYCHPEGQEDSNGERKFTWQWNTENQGEKESKREVRLLPGQRKFRQNLSLGREVRQSSLPRTQENVPGEIVLSISLIKSTFQFWTVSVRQKNTLPSSPLHFPNRGQTLWLTRLRRRGKDISQAVGKALRFSPTTVTWPTAGTNWEKGSAWYFEWG